MHGGRLEWSIFYKAKTMNYGWQLLMIPLFLWWRENHSKPKAQYGEADYRMLAKNVKAKYILLCGLGPDKFYCISGCTTAKHIWDTLLNAHKGTSLSKEKESVIGMYVDYDTHSDN